MMSFALSAEKKRRINSWQDLFSEPVERVYMMMKDGLVLNHTSHYGDKIYMSIEALETTLKKFNKNYRIKDIAIIIHNHFKDFRFSPEDHKQYRRLKKHGFNGSFLLYSHLTKKVYDIEEKEKSE